MTWGFDWKQLNDVSKYQETNPEIQRLRHQYLKQSAPWQERHNLEIKSQVRFVEFRYRDYPVMRKEDL